MPFMPFMADMIYTNITGEESVHLADWPLVTTPEVIDTRLIKNMSLVRRICEMGHADRKANTIAVKQPLSKITIIGSNIDLQSEPELLQLIKDELNVLEVVFRTPSLESEKKLELIVELDRNLTPELILRGQMREVIRSIQEARKTAGCQLDEVVTVALPDWPREYEDEIKRKTLVKAIVQGEEIRIIRA